MFVWTLRDGLLVVGFAVAISLMVYGYVEYRVKEWRKKKNAEIKKKINSFQRE